MRLPLSARARYIALAASAAVLAGTFAYIYLGGLSRRVPVLVASRDFGAYTTLEPDLVGVAFLPAAAVHPRALTRPEDAAGRVSLVPRAAGEQILETSLVTGTGPGEFRAGLAPDERAFFLPADAVLGGWLGAVRGDFVDLTVVFPEGQSFCLGQGIEVLEVIAQPGESGLIARGEEPPAGVLLRTTPPEAERLALAAECGRVYFALAGYDAVTVPTQGAWIDQIFEGGETPDEPLWP